MKNKIKLGTETGSLMNYLMGNNITVPVVGEGATVLGYTDRHAYEVIEVSPDFRSVTIQRYNPKRIDTDGIGDSQEYEYEELYPHTDHIVWKWNSWRLKVKRYDGKPGWEYPKINIVFGIRDEYYDYSI